MQRSSSPTLFPYTTLFRSVPRSVVYIVEDAVYVTSVKLTECISVTLRSAEQSIFFVEFDFRRSEEHTSELQSQSNLVCRLLLEKKNYEIALLEVTAGSKL